MSSYAAELTAILDRENPIPTLGGDIDYTVGATAFRGYVARPESADSGPGVLVIHDWLGVSDYVRMRCDMLARLGYVAFAGDIYGADVRPSGAEAPTVASEYYRNPALWRSRVTGSYEQLLALPGVDPARTAAVGYCFGGATVLQLARTGAGLRAAVSVHGGLQAGLAGEAEGMRAALLVLSGAIDPVVPDDAVQAFEDEMRRVPSLRWELTRYSGAMHAFTIPSANSPEHGAQFNAVAERRSWASMKDFLAESLS